jgi:type II secretion system protein N
MLKKILLYGLAYPAFFLLALILGAYWTFPYDHLRDYIVERVEQGGTVQLEIGRLEPSWLTSVEIENVRIVTVPREPSQGATELVIQQAQARISLLSLIAGTTEVTFDAQLDGGGTLQGSYADSGDSMHVVAQIRDVDLRRIGPLRDAVTLPIMGRLSGDIDLTVAEDAANTQGTAELTIRNLSVGDGETQLGMEALGPVASQLTLERMNLGTLRLRLQATRGVGTIETLRAEGEHAEIWGSGTIRLVQPVRMSALDMLIRIQIKDAYRNANDRMRGLFTMLDMAPQVRPARTSNGALQWRLQGAIGGGRMRSTPSGRTPMPGVDGEAAEPE